MAAWTRVEDADYITFTREDGAAGYKISKNHPHFHAEQWMPWTDAPPHTGGGHAATAAYFQQSLEDRGDTVT